MEKYLRVSWASYGKMASSLAKEVEEKRMGFDLVIGIARGGIPLAMVISDLLGIPIDIINVKSYTGIRKREKPKILTTLSNDIKGKRILLVDDLIEHGATMDLLLAYLVKKKPGMIKTAVLFDKPWSRFRPDYCVKTVDRWVVFPWERNEFERNLKSGNKK